MSLSDFALGLASIAVGLNSLRKGANHLSAATRPKTRSFQGVQNVPQPVKLPGNPLLNSGYRNVHAPNGQRVPMQMRSYGIRGLDDRITYLQRLVDVGKRDPHVYAFARRAVSKKCGGAWCINEKDNLSEAKAIFGAVRGAKTGDSGPDVESAKNLFRQIRRNVRYTSDIAGVDTYQKPSHTLALKSGDCDDYSTLTCSALQSIGIPCRFKVIRTKGANDWNHIYPQAGFPRQNPTRWVSMDSSVNMPFGWEAPPSMVSASKVFRVG